MDSTARPVLEEISASGELDAGNDAQDRLERSVPYWNLSTRAEPPKVQDLPAVWSVEPDSEVVLRTAQAQLHGCGNLQVDFNGIRGIWIFSFPVCCIIPNKAAGVHCF